MAKQMLSVICLLILYCESASARDDSFSATASARDDSLTATASARDDSFTAMVKHIERLDAKIEQLEDRHNAEMEALKDNAKLREAELVTKIEKLDKRVSSLEAKNGALMKKHFRFRTKTFMELLRQSDRDGDEIHNIASHDVITEKEKKTINKIRQDSREQHNAEMLKPRRALQNTYNVAFSAYMDRDANGLGIGQTLVFNQVLLNDGNGYNKHTGIFMVPIAGVYSFTFFTGQRDAHQLWTALYVNSVNKVDAVVQTDNSAEDAQGGNSAVLKLAAGDAVYVKNQAGDHADSSGTHRLTTFSGFLLYLSDGGAVLEVGK